MKAIQRWLAAAMLIGMCWQPATGQVYEDDYPRVFTPVPYIGVGFNTDINHPIFTASLYANFMMGMPTDMLSLNVGFGYRGFFDSRPPVEFLRWENRTLAYDFFYSSNSGDTRKEVRPVGGQIVLPAEIQLRLIRLSDDIRMYLGFGAELGWRVYESDRYADYYGDHMLNRRSLNIRPMLGVSGGDDEVNFNISLYWRHYTRCPLNYENLYKPDKFDAQNFFGIQFNVSFGFF